MKSGLRDLCGAMCAVMSAKAIVFGLASVGVALSVLMRM